MVAAVPPVDSNFLVTEYVRLQEIVEEFDQRALTIKTWSVTTSITVIGAAFNFSSPALLLVGAASALLFWQVEARWKEFQQAYYPRIYEIEDYKQGRSSPDFSTPRIARSWSQEWQSRANYQCWAWPHVYLPHCLIALVGIALWLINIYYPIVPLPTK